VESTRAVAVKGRPQASLDLEDVLVECLRADKVRVPPYPAVAAKLQSVTAGEGYGMREIVPIVAADSTLSAAVLRQANSAMAMRSRPVDSLEAAVLKLGAQEIVRLALAQTVGKAASAPGALASLRREQWRSSLISATLCQGLAPRRGIRPELAFMAGLLHDFGAVVVVACLEEIGGARELPTLPEGTWREVIDNFHIDFGMVVASRWKLPEALTEVMASHHHPDGCLRPYRPLVQLVALIDQVIAALAAPPVEGQHLLDGVAGLEPADRTLVTGLLPKLEETLASFEACLPSRGAVREVASKIEVEPPAGSWPVDFEVALGNPDKALRACAMAPNSLSVRSPTPLRPNWLAKLTLRVEPEHVDLMVNVKSCEATPDGRHLITVQPFGLDGQPKSVWLQLLTSTRRSLGLPGTKGLAAG
jgi:HD-like signal output (HDOD) protein